MSADFTVFVAGVAVSSLAYLLAKFVGEPIIRIREAIDRALDLLTVHAYLYANPGTGQPELVLNAAMEFRRSSAELRTRWRRVVWRPVWAGLGVIPKGDDLGEASSKLIFLSNAMGSAGMRAVEVADVADEVEALLTGRGGQLGGQSAKRGTSHR